jgi:hypothetical protein
MKGVSRGPHDNSVSAECVRVRVPRATRTVKAFTVDRASAGPIMPCKVAAL